ncbi:unnamed protein product [Pleuronectes platessa]|uniref:Uncharacterized protein n=1 Tax=Pleuronectes platessa TaxID=8262 RepID=A0A9N7VZI6_PLEPL|nr:unnamed protein product [Pleuronectes platessa]
MVMVESDLVDQEPDSVLVWDHSSRTTPSDPSASSGPAANIEEASFMTFTAAGHKGVIKMSWLHFGKLAEGEFGVWCRIEASALEELLDEGVCSCRGLSPLSENPAFSPVNVKLRSRNIDFSTLPT